MTEPRPRIALALLVLVVLTGVGAIPAGIGLLADPSGANLGMSPELLEGGPFRDFTIPGLFLLVVLGFGAAIPAWGLRTRKPWGATAALGYGIILLAWVTIQALIIGIVSPLQPVYGTVGLLISVFAVAVRREAADA
jgi:hypothetical protein